MEIRLEDYIRDIPDWPVKGVLFRDITPLLGSAQALKAETDGLTASFKPGDIDYVAAVEARGFIFGGAVAEKLEAGFIPIRKKGKLPFERIGVSYELEYGTDTLEVHRDAVVAGARILLVDDLIATGGSMAAACELFEKLGAEIAGIAFLIELTGLGGVKKLSKYKVNSLIKYR